MQTIAVVGVDIAKSVFQVHATCCGMAQVVTRRRLRRGEVMQVLPTAVALPWSGWRRARRPIYWAREIATLGHQVRLMPAAYVKPYVKRGKTDAADAEAIAEAVTRPTMRFVAVKTVEQQAVLMLHKTRDLLVRQRTMLINALRGHLAEYGVVAAKGPGGLSSLVTMLHEVQALPAAAWRDRRCTGIASQLRALGAEVERLETEDSRMAPR